MLDGERLLRHPAAGLGEVDRVLATVGGGRAALDQPRFRQPVDQARDVALGDIEPLRQFLLADALLLGQGGQDVALRDRDADLAQAFADRRLHPRLETDQPEPDPDGAVGVLPVGHRAPFLEDGACACAGP